MRSKCEIFLRFFSSCLQLARMYGTDHPKFKQNLEMVYQELQSILGEQKKLIIAVVGKELTSGDEIFFDLSKKLTSLIQLLSDKGVQKIIFKKGIEERELKLFILFFLGAEEKVDNIKDYFETKEIKNIEVDKIRESSPKFGVSSKVLGESYDLIYSQTVSSLSNSLTNLIQGQQVDFNNFTMVVDNIVKGIDNYYQEILKLSKLKGKDTVTFAHILNVSFLAVSFARSLGFSDSLCRKIGLAGLFHDIGKLYISSKMLKDKKLSEADFEKIKGHSLLGAEILLKHIDKVGELSLVAALEHHLRFDLKGYPRPRFSRQLHFASMLIAICDVYDALSQRRSYKNNYPPELIYEIMKEGRGSHLEPELFDAFFNFMGIWPGGTIVVLNNGKIARVESQNFGDIFLPNVKILSDSPYERVDLRQTKNKLKIEKSLNPYKEGKKYLK